MFVVLITLLDAFAKLRKATYLHVRPPARPQGTTRLPLDEFSQYLVFEYPSKICRLNSSFIKIGQE